MPDELAQGFVSIIPDFTQFDALLQAKITAALAQIQATSTGAAGAASAATAPAALQQTLPGFAAIQASATGAANAVNQQLTPALKAVVPAANSAGGGVQAAGSEPDRPRRAGAGTGRRSRTGLVQHHHRWRGTSEIRSAAARLRSQQGEPLRVAPSAR